MKFYGHFAAAYGTMWLAMLGLALITQTRINTGTFGLIGFPIIALVYAFIRLWSEPSHDETMRLQQRLLRRVAELEEELRRSKNGH